MARKILKPVALCAAIVVAGAAVYLAANYSSHNLEKTAMTEEARRGVEGSFIRLSQGVTHYQLAGSKDGRTVVLVHGFSVPYFIWDQTFDPLVQAGFRVLRYDSYGRGYSDRPDVTYDADLYDAQLAELLAALKITGPVDLVAASMGGPIVVTFAARHPEQVRALALFDPAYLTGFTLPWAMRTTPVGEYLMCVSLAPKLPDSQKEDFIHPERYPDYFARYREQMRYQGFRRALLSTIRYYLARDGRQAYQTVGKSGRPILLVWGRADKDVPFEVSNEVLRALPQAEFHPMDDAAHVPFYEHPETVNPMLVNFLRAH